MLIAILAFAAGVYVGYKYPRQVEQAVEAVKKFFSNVKDMISKKGSPPSPPPGS